MVEKQDLLRALHDFSYLVGQMEIAPLAPHIATSMAKLDGYSNAIQSIQRAAQDDEVEPDPAAIDAIISSRGFQSLVQEAELTARKINDDEKLSDLLHDRICNKQGIPSAYDHADAGQRGHADYVGEIADLLKTLTKAKADHFPEPLANEPRRSDGKRYLPEDQKYKETLAELSGLKGKIVSERLKG